MNEAISLRKPLIMVVIGKGDDGASCVKRVEISPFLITRANNALEQAKQIKDVQGEMSMEAAVEALSALKGVYEALETSRKTVKEPFKNAVEMIDGATKKYTLPNETEKKRINGLIVAFNSELIRQATIKKAELERQSRELQREANETRDPEHAETLAEASHALHLEARMVERPKVAGLSISPKYSPRLENFQKVAATNPHLLKQELDTCAVNDMIRALSDGGQKPLASDAIPGITLIPSAVVGIRR